MVNWGTLHTYLFKIIYPEALKLQQAREVYNIHFEDKAPNFTLHRLTLYQCHEVRAGCIVERDRYREYNIFKERKFCITDAEIGGHLRSPTPVVVSWHLRSHLATPPPLQRSVLNTECNIFEREWLFPDPNAEHVARFRLLALFHACPPSCIYREANY